MVTGKGTVLQKAKVSGCSCALSGPPGGQDCTQGWGGGPSDPGGTSRLCARALRGEAGVEGVGAVSLALTSQKGVLANPPEGVRTLGAAYRVISSRFWWGRGKAQRQRGARKLQFKENLSDSEGRLSGERKQQIQAGDGFAGSHPGSWR